MVAPVIPNVFAPLGIVLIDPTTGVPYVASGGGGTPGAGVTGVGGYSSYVSPAGAQNNVNPGSGFPLLLGRIDVDTSAGDANWTGLLAGVDGQIVLIRNAAGANNLTLNSQNASSTAANRFAGSGDFVLPAGGAIWVIYYAGSVNRWVIVP